MPSAKERMKKYREKMKRNSEKYAEHLRNERERDLKRREKVKEVVKKDPKLQAISRKKIRDRVRAHRQKLKATKNIDSVSIPSIGSYKSLQTFGKAVRKLKKNLPNSPCKTVAVVKKLAFDVLGCENMTQKKDKKKDERTEKAVREFYYKDDISRQAPGIKDFKTVRDPVTGKKARKQKRYMIVTIREAYEFFKDNHPDTKIGKSAFHNLRPTEVLPVSYTVHNVCVCAQHSNILSRLESVGKCLAGFPKTHKELFNYITCSPENEACMLSSCKNCPKDFWNKFKDDECLEKSISWNEWTNLGGRPKVKTKTMSCKAVLKELESNMEKFKIHCFVKKVQSACFEDSKKHLQDGEAIVQIDFAENYALVSQDEIQSAHWSHDQVTIFTCCIWLSNQETKSIVIVSDDTSHTKYAVWTFLNKIFVYLKEVKDSITTVKIFSDNCAAQFKNRYTLALLNNLKEYADLDKLQWEFFAASHGKGAVDGLGGTVKRVAWTGVKARKVILNSAEDFYMYVKTEVKGIHIAFVSKNDIEKDKNLLDSLWEHVVPIKGVQTQHHFEAVDNVSIVVARTSKSNPIIVKIKEDNEARATLMDLDDDSDFDNEDLLPLATVKALEYENTKEDDIERIKEEEKENVYQDKDIEEQFEIEDIEETVEIENLVRSKINEKIVREREFNTGERIICRIPLKLLPARFSSSSLEAVLNIKRKLRYNEVYTDSEDESDLCNSVSVRDINPGVFVLVRIVAEGKKQKEFRYAAVCQSSVCEGDVQVMYLKRVTANTFISNENDVSHVLFTNIICTLSSPELKIRGDRTYYSFLSTVDVFEQ